MIGINFKRKQMSPSSNCLTYSVIFLIVNKKSFKGRGARVAKYVYWIFGQLVQQKYAWEHEGWTIVKMEKYVGDRNNWSHVNVLRPIWSTLDINPLLFLSRHIEFQLPPFFSSTGAKQNILLSRKMEKLPNIHAGVWEEEFF